MMRPSDRPLKKRAAAAPLSSVLGDRAAVRALGAVVVLAALGVDASTSPANANGWRTEVRRIAAPPPTDPGSVRPPPAPRVFDPGAPASALSLRADAAPSGDGRFFAARAALAKGAERGPYVGAGLEPGDASADASAALLGGIAAPFVAGSVLFGEVQQLQSVDGEEERRLWLGLRTGF